METEKSSETLYSFIHTYESAKHERNIGRIKIVIRCFFIIPLLLLGVMFFTGSSNVAFLLLWIVSLFGIAAYAISIEYKDYELQKRMHIIDLLENGATDIEYNDLVLLPLINEKELINSGLDRENVHRMLTLFNHQRRMKRRKSKALEDAADAGDKSENTPAKDEGEEKNAAVIADENTEEKPTSDNDSASTGEKEGSEP